MHSSCKKDNTVKGTGTPVITGIRAYKPSPHDSVLVQTGPGAYVVLQGSHLTGVTAVYFDGIKASINTALGSDNNFPVMVPSIIPFSSVAAAQLNTIEVVTSTGQVTYKFPIVPPAPTITGISNEDANPGDSVKIYGLNFFFVQTLTYAGLPVTSYTSSNDGTYIKLAVPTGVTQTGGLVSITTKSGTVSTAYSVHDFVDGVFQNWDNVNGYPWGCGSSNSPAAYPGNTGWYGQLSASNLPANDSQWWAEPGVNMGGSQWVPASDISNSLANYAVKFEISVPNSTPWANGSIYVAVNYGFNYIALYQPWKNSDGSITPFSTNGWQTVTIPLSNFKSSNGTGTPAASITALVGASGNNGMNIWYLNDSSVQVAAFAAAIDNIRVVKIN